MFGYHIWDVPLDTIISERKVSLAIEYLYVFSSVPIKLSILLFYRRLAKGTLTNTFTILIRASIIFVLAYLIVFTLTISLFCRPYSAYWNQFSLPWLAAGNTYTCYDEGANVLAASSISLCQDFVATLLPMVLFRRLAMPRAQKLALASVFALGFFSCFAGIMRTWYVWRVFWDTYDITCEFASSSP